MPRILLGKPIIDALKARSLERVALLKNNGFDPALPSCALVRVPMICLTNALP